MPRGSRRQPLLGQLRSPPTTATSTSSPRSSSTADNGVDGQENLYDYRDGQLQFVTALEHPGPSLLERQCRSTAADGRRADGDSRRRQSHGVPHGEQGDRLRQRRVIRRCTSYTPATDELTCVSCLPSGEPPSTNVTASHNGRFMTDDGRTFFETDDALVPQDTNEAGDVYEYVDGRPQLITSGTASATNSFGLATLHGDAGPDRGQRRRHRRLLRHLRRAGRPGPQRRSAQDLRRPQRRRLPVHASGPPCVAADECHGPEQRSPRARPERHRRGPGRQREPAVPRRRKHRARRHKKRRHKRHRRRRHTQGRGGAMVEREPAMGR